MKRASTRRITDDMLRTIIVKRLPKLLEKEPPLRDYLASLVAGRFADKGETEREIKELLAIIKEQNKRLEEQNKRLEEQNKRIEEQNKRLEEHSKILEEHSKILEEHSRILREHSKTLEEQNKRLEEHSKILEAQNKRLEEHSKILEAQNKKLEEHSRILEEHSRILEAQNKKLEEHSKILEEHSRILREHSFHLQELYKEVKSLRRSYDKSIGALGARWGLRSERSFRNAMKAILEEDFGVKVEQYLAFDPEGEVFGNPDQVEIDLIIRDGKIIAIEIKSSISRGDVFMFNRKIQFYENKEGKKVSRAIIISPMVESKAIELAKKYGMEVYGEPEEVPLDEEGNN